MPILNVEIVTHPNEHIHPSLAMELANRTGEIFNSAPGNTWVTVHLIGGENYAENGNSSDKIFQVFVSVLKLKWSSSDALQAEVAKLLSFE